jgi:uncharacterized protein (TIGR03790 family)
MIRLLLVVVVVLAARQVRAGGGPENVLLVVNPRRADSLTIANHYASLRQVPASNIFYLGWDGSMDTITVDVFRSQFLQPIFAEIDRRRLEGQIDYIVYSSGYPFSVDFGADAPGPTQQHAGTRGSLTGLTYLCQLVRNRDLAYVFSATEMRNNFYQSSQTRGFSSAQSWAATGGISPLGGRNYYLSTMLGYTDGRGNSVDEVVNYLRRGALADGTRPDGTIYLMKIDGEVRSSTRHDAFPQIVALLEREGVRAQVMVGVLPKGRQDVIGIMTGRSNLLLDRTPLKILPGAICDHLTSFGGDLRATAHQTPLSDFLRYGAVGASGTVMEPLAVQAKFPHPIMHVHYARGATLAEAFYQAVASPYQLLIVGDPLCRPWARIPQIAVDGVAASQTVRGDLKFTPRSETLPVKSYRLFVDGRLIKSCRPAEAFEIDTTKVGDGYHELRVVGIEDSPIESQGRLIIPVQVANQNGQINAAVQPKVVSAMGRVQCFVSAPGASSISLFHNRRQLGQVKGNEGVVTIDARELGSGPVLLTAVGLGGKRVDKVFSQPILLTIQQPASANLSTGGR